MKYIRETASLINDNDNFVSKVQQTTDKSRLIFPFFSQGNKAGLTVAFVKIYNKNLEQTMDDGTVALSIKIDKEDVSLYTQKARKL